MNKTISKKILKNLIKSILICLISITVTCGFNTYVSAKNDIKVKRLKLTKTKKKMTLIKGTKKKIKVRVLPKKATNKKLSFKSSNRKVVTVSKKGVIKAKNKGKAKITIKTKDGSNIKCVIRITVKNKVKDTTKTNNLDTENNNDKTDEGSKKTEGKDDTEDSGKTKPEEPEIEEPEKVLSPDSYIILHRGYSDIAPENSLAAFNLAVNSNCKGVECDVQETKDGKLVISHDNSLSRMFGISVDISESNWDDIKDLTMTGGNNVKDYPNEKIPTIEEYLNIIKASDKTAFIELKDTITEDGLKLLAETVNSYGMNDRVFYISFYTNELIKIREFHEELSGEGEALPQYTLLGVISTLTVDSTTNLTLLDYCIENNFNIGVAILLNSEESIEKMHEAGLLVTMYSVDSKDYAYLLLEEIGVDMITSNTCFI